MKRIEVKSNEDNNAIDIQIEYYYSGETTESISLSVERTR